MRKVRLYFLSGMLKKSHPKNIWSHCCLSSRLYNKRFALVIFVDKNPLEKSTENPKYAVPFLLESKTYLRNFDQHVYLIFLLDISINSCPQHLHGLIEELFTRLWKIIQRIIQKVSSSEFQYVPQQNPMRNICRI